MSKDSLKKRYFYKLFSNSFGMGMGVVTQVIVLRGLGPQNYGNFNFLTNFFTQIVGFFHMSTPTALYTKLSQRQKDTGLVIFYSYFMGIVALLVFGITIAMHALGFSVKLWPGQPLSYVYLACLFALLTWVGTVLYQIADAYGLTVSAEKRRVVQMVISFIVVATLFVMKRFNLATFLVCRCLILVLLMLLLIKLIGKKIFIHKADWSLPSVKAKEYTKEFYHYSHPLFTYSLAALVVGILDRWLLQYFGGSIQQGFYSLSFQIGAICFLFSGAMTTLITREFSIAYGNKDLDTMANLFRRHVPLLYVITAFFACFVMVNAGKITIIMGGGKYQQATTAVAIMALYPIHQTYGQLSNSVFHATGQTKLYRNVGIIFSLISLPLTYFLIAPKELLGLNAGANGLAIKMVVVNFLIVNVLLYYNARLLKLSFLWYLGHQIISVLVLSTIAVFSSFFVRSLSGISENVLITFILSGIVYAVICFLFVYAYPSIVGMDRKGLKTQGVKFFRRR